MDYILNFEKVDKGSLPLVGGKNASLGEMIKAGIRVPPGFAVTTDSYLKFIVETDIKDKIYGILSELDPDDVKSLTLHLPEQRRQIFRDLVLAEPGDQGQTARLVVRVKLFDQSLEIVQVVIRPDFDADGVEHPTHELDVGAVHLPGPLTDPEQVGGTAVAVTGGGVDPGE